MLRPHLPSTAPPGPRGYPVLGVLPQAWQNPLPFFVDTARRYGGIVRLRLGTVRAFLLSHPDYIEYVLRENHHNYRKSPRVKRVKPLFGEGLTTSEGEVWRRRRRLMQPAFHHQRIAALATTMTDTIGAMLARWQSTVAAGPPFDIAAEMGDLTLRIVSRTLFGTDLAGETVTVRRAVALVEQYLNERVWAFWDLPMWLPTRRHRRLKWAIHTLEQVVYRIIEARRCSGKETADLLGMLLRARYAETGAGMSDTQLRDEVMTLVFAGHETTAAALAWTWYLVAKYPRVQQRLRAELREILMGRVPASSNLPQLSYTRMVIEEAMRLYPPTWVTARTPLQDDSIGGYRLPARAVVLLSPYVMHRHPAFWEQPAVFAPERFAAARSGSRPRYAYFPFGGGPRLCIGKDFALMEAQLVVAMVLQHYEVRLVPDHPIEPQPLLTLRPRHGVLVTLHPCVA
jgi:cytochrome P450